MLRSKTSLMMTMGIIATLSGAALAQDTPAKMQSGTMQNGSGRLSSADRNYLNTASDANLTEIKTSELALKYATQQDLKDFAQNMIDDHTKAQDELKQLAASKGVTLKEQPSAKHRAAYAKLSSLRGAAFDSSYTKIQRQGHAEAAQKFQSYMSRVHDADVKAYDAKYLPAVQEHLQMIKGMKMPGSMGKM